MLVIGGGAMFVSPIGGRCWALVAVGYRNQAETFPYGFFKWWRLNPNVVEFE